MQLAIAQNPHLEAKNQKVLWDELNRYDTIATSPKEFNDDDFGTLKALLTQSPHFTVK